MSCSHCSVDKNVVVLVNEVAEPCGPSSVVIFVASTRDHRWSLNLFGWAACGLHLKRDFVQIEDLVDRKELLVRDNHEWKISCI